MFRFFLFFIVLVILRVGILFPIENLMLTSLELLKTKKVNIHKELDQLKSLTQSQAREQKQEQIATEISELDQELKRYLNQESDKAKKAEAQEIVEELKSFSSALKSLKQEVLQNPKNEAGSLNGQASLTVKEASLEEEKKNFLQKGMDWIK